MAEEKRVRQAGPSLQCPRCGSNNTKFCYYNNYNTAQPRHFCRECHRYWTQGGALRNIPAPGESTNRKRSRRYSTGSSSQTASKMPRIQAESSPGNSTVVAGAALAAIAISPAPPLSPAPILFGEGIGMVGAGFPLRPTLPLFDQGFIRGLRGFPPFNSLLFPTPPPPLPLPLLHGLNMNQVLNVNAGDGSGASGAANDHVHMHARDGGNAQDGNGGDLFANQFFTRFVDADVGGGTRADFNAGQDEATNQTGAAADGGVAATTDDPGPAPPANFI